MSKAKIGVQYKEVQKENPESWNAFLRRIHEVRIYDRNGTVTSYESVEKYLRRKEEFCTLTSEDDCPFGIQEKLLLD